MRVFQMTKFSLLADASEHFAKWHSNPDYVNQYAKYLRNPGKELDTMNDSERKIQSFLSKLGKCTRIATSSEKEPDFLISVQNLVIEVTSINTIYGKDFTINAKSETEWLEKIWFTLTEKEIKFSKKYAEMTKIVVIYIDFMQWYARGTILDRISLKSNVLSDTNVDALLIYYSKVGGNVENKTPFLICRNREIGDIFQSIYNKSELFVHKPSLLSQLLNALNFR